MKEYSYLYNIIIYLIRRIKNFFWMKRCFFNEYFFLYVFLILMSERNKDRFRKREIYKRIKREIKLKVEKER